ncbi:MAG: malonyl-CoA decarboxylase-domain-containing protein, partial [Piptocephalis tieghemiana]
TAVDEWLRLTLEEWLLGYLDLKRITWTSPAIVLEHMANYEAVHFIRSWGDMRRRLGPGRRCYAFFHRSMPYEPLVFVQVALTESISDNVQAILNDRNPGHRSPNTIRSAMFYSITSRKGKLTPPASFHLMVVLTMPRWHRDTVLQKSLRGPLLALSGHYLLGERRQGMFSLDPVGHFHLRNGACVHRLNWLANNSDKGIGESFGMMVNYHYILPRVEQHNQMYVSKGIIMINPEDKVLKLTEERLEGRGCRYV